MLPLSTNGGVSGGAVTAMKRPGVDASILIACFVQWDEMGPWRVS